MNLVAPQKRFLVTGGAGFIGSHLCERLLEDGHYVICLDSFFTGHRGNLQAAARYADNLEVIRHDVTQPFDFEVDGIFNLACPASPIHYQRDPIHTIRTSYLGAENTLELARRLRAPVVHTSTSEVYGDPEQHPQTEGYWGNVNPIGPRACYDESKRCAETLMFAYRSHYGLPTKTVRIFNTYGPRMHPNDGRVVSTFIVQALQNKPITVFGAGTQTRSFCYVDDMVDALMRVMKTGDEFSGPVNLGNPVELEVGQLAELIVEMTGSSSPIIRKPLPQDDPRKRRPDISVAKAELGWEPTTGIHDGLTRTIAHFEEALVARSAPIMATLEPQAAPSHPMPEVRQPAKVTQLAS